MGEYEPEQIWAYAAGRKSEFFDQRLQLNLEGFFYRYQDMQIALIDGTAIAHRERGCADVRRGAGGQGRADRGLSFGAVIGHLNTETIDYFSLDPATPGQSELRDELLGARTASLAKASSAYGSPDLHRPTDGQRCTNSGRCPAAR